MNKIIWNTEELSEKIECLEIKGEKTTLKIQNHVEIKNIIFPSMLFHTTWILEENASLEIHCLLSCENINGIWEINSTNGTHCLIHLGIKAKSQNELKIQNQIEGNQNHSEIKIRIVGEEKSKTKMTTTGILQKNTQENVFLEDVKYLNEEESEITCIPELIVDSNEVVANHNVTIGTISKEDLFYLESKGIEEQKAKNLIRECFLNSVLKNQDREEEIK